MSDYPYPGIRPFKREETDIFFGREKQADDLIDRLGAARFLAVVGPSGCGKSSLVKTGMIPGLEIGFLASAGAAWNVVEMRPGTAPFRNLAEALSETLAALRSSGGEAVEPILRKSTLGLHHFLEACPLPENTNLLILVDQFEELFRYADNADASAEAAAFVSLLLAGSRPYPLPDGRMSRRIYAVITMRSDFIGDCARFPGLAEAVNRGLYLTPRLTREQLREAVAEPPLVTDCDMEPALAARLLEDVEDDPDQLPLLQHVLQWMWLRGREMGADVSKLTLADYETLGGFGKALSDRLDGIYKGLSPEQQKIAETLFRSLSKRDLEQRDIRRPVRLKHVAELAEAEPDEVMAVADAFRRESRNFIVLSDDPEDPENPLMDVCHESLLRQWKTLRGWLEDEAESGAMYRRVEDAAMRWKNGGDLWRELELVNALAWKDEFQPTPLWAKRYGRGRNDHFETAMTFLEESRKAEEARINEQEELIRRLEKSEKAAVEAKAQIEKLEKKRTRDLFESHLTHASLQAKIEDYAAAKKILEKSREIEADIPPARRHARDLLNWYAGLMSGTADKVYEGAGMPLFKVAVSPDGKLLAAVGEKGTVVLFDAETGEVIRRLEGHQRNNSVFALVFHPEGKWLATAGNDKYVMIWSLPEGQIFRIIETPDKAGWVALSPDGNLLATRWKNNAIVLWNPETGEKIRTLRGHSGMISGLAFSPDGTRLASASYDHTAMIWEVETGNMVHRLKAHAGNIQKLAFHPDGHMLATCSSDQTVILWHTEGGHPTAFLRGHENIVLDVAFDESGDRLISASYDRTLRIWDTDTGVTMQVLQGHEFSVTGLTVKGHALFSTSNDGTLRKWHLGPDDRMQVVDVAGEPGSSAISPDGTLVAVGFDDRALRLFSLSEMEEIWETPNVNTDRTLRIVFSSDNKYIAAGSLDETVKLWRTDTGELEHTFKGHTGIVHGIDFSPDGNFIATAGYDGKIGLFDIRQKEGELFEGHEGRAASVAFDSTANIIVTSGGDDGRTRLWDIRSDPPKFLRDFPKSMDGIWWATISPDGTRVAAVGRDALVHIFNVADGTEIHRFVGHENMIYRVAFSPDGEQIATVSSDATVRFWDLGNMENLFTIELPTNQSYPVPLWDFSFRCTPTGCYIVVPLTRGKIVVYRMDNFYGLNR